jgi:hypothetical protein
MAVSWRRLEAIRRAAEFEPDVYARADRVVRQVEREGGLDSEAQMRLLRDLMFEFLRGRCDTEMQGKLIRALVACRNQKPMMAVRG